MMKYYDASPGDALKQLGLDLAVVLLLVTFPIWTPLLKLSLSAWDWVKNVRGTQE